MEQKERHALDRCFSSFLKDLDPSPSFLHSLYADGVLTEEQMDTITKVPSRESRVALLVGYLPKRGPNAFNLFKNRLEKNYLWLAQRLDDKMKELKSISPASSNKRLVQSISPASSNKRLVGVIETQLVPLVYEEASGFDMCDEKAHPGVIIQKLSDLLNSLELECHKALDMPKGHVLGKHKVPINKLIEDRLKQDKKSEADEKINDLNKEIRDLKKQVRELCKVKAENEKLKNINLKQKEKLKYYDKMSRESKKCKQDMEKLKKETEMLKTEVETLREQLRNNISNPFA